MDRIVEIYAMVWNPVPRPSEGLPLNPYDHVRCAKMLAEDPGSLREVFWPSVRNAVGEQLADEYIELLEASARWNLPTTRKPDSGQVRDRSVGAGR